MDKREKLSSSAQRLLNLIIKYRNRKLNLRGYAYLMQTSRRWTRICLSELRQKGYVKVYPESMKIHKTQTCKYVLLDENGREIP